MGLFTLLGAGRKRLFLCWVAIDLVKHLDVFSGACKERLEPQWSSGVPPSVQQEVKVNSGQQVEGRNLRTKTARAYLFVKTIPRGGTFKFSIV